MAKRELIRRARREHGSDLRGAAAALVQATTGVTRVVENMHGAIGAFPVITTLIYAGVRSITGMVGAGVDAALAGLTPLLGESVPGPEREAVLAALNGVVGDHLEATGNPLAIPMSLRAPLHHDGGTLLVLVHGSCMNDLQWARGGHDHGRALARDLGLTPAYVHYNSGRHISTNGKQLAGLLELECARFRNVVVIGHSMGGLVARAAVVAAGDACHAWPRKLRSLVTIGAPHHGAPLERGGNSFETLLSATPWSAPLQAVGRVRSAGVTDLRHGNIVDADWQHGDRFAYGPDRRTPTPLPDDVHCYAVAGTNSPAGTAEGRLSSDNLVPVKSALGIHREDAFTLRLTDSRIVYATNHLALLSSLEVYAAMRGWLGSRRRR